MQDATIKRQVIKLRRGGKTYGEIKHIIGANIPKSTLSNWCNGILLSELQEARISEAMQVNAARGREIAVLVNRKKREIYLFQLKMEK